MKRIGSAVILGLLIAGCDQVQEIRLQNAKQELRAECFGTFTNACESKTIDYNIMLLEDARDQMIAKAESGGLVTNEKEADIWKQVVTNGFADLIDGFENERPGFFSRLILSDAQPFDGKSVRILEQEDFKKIMMLVAKDFSAKLKRQEENHQSYEDYWKAASENLDQKQEVSTAEAKASTEHSSATPAQLAEALQAIIARQVQDGGGSEFEEARETVFMDLDADGVDDAVVLYSIEGADGSNSTYKFLASLYSAKGKWQHGGSSQVDSGSSGLKHAGNGIIELLTLTHGDDDPMCCPSREAAIYYRWADNQFLVTENPKVASEEQAPVSRSSRVAHLDSSSLQRSDTAMQTILECSMTSKLVGQMESIDIISTKANRISMELGMSVTPEEAQVLHDRIKTRWNLKSMDRAAQDELLVEIYNSEACQSLHGQPRISVTDVPADA